VSELKYPNLRDMSAGNIVAVTGSSPSPSPKQIDIQAAASKPKEAGTVETIQAERGMMFRHKVRGTKVCILTPQITVSKNGEQIHLVVESRTGRKFKALNSNLEAL